MRRSAPSRWGARFKGGTSSEMVFEAADVFIADDFDGETRLISRSQKLGSNTILICGPHGADSNLARGASS
jgi:hypothetical protein